MCDPCQSVYDPCQPKRTNQTELATLARRLRRCEQLRNINVSLEQTAPAGVLPLAAFSILITVTNNSVFSTQLQVINVLEYDINGGDPALLSNIQWTIIAGTGTLTLHQQSASWSLVLPGASSATLQVSLLQGAPDDPAVVRSFAYVNLQSNVVSTNIGI